MGVMLAGLVVLMIGDSHLATPGYLITTLHDDLTQQGAAVYSFGACGAAAGDWVSKTKIESPPPCGIASREKEGKVKLVVGAKAATTPYAELVKTYKPDLVVVVMGDTMAGYTQPAMPKAWIWQHVSALTKAIKASGTKCVWVGPAWGTEGGQFGKTYARVSEVSGYLSEIVSPCTYVNSLKLSKPGEWATLDGQHFKSPGYKSWGAAITTAITTPPIVTGLHK